MEREELESVAAHTTVDDLAQSDLRAVETGLHVVGRDSGDLRHFFGAHALQLPEHEYQAVADRNGIDGLAENEGELASAELVLGSVAVRSIFAHGLVPFDEAAILPQAREGLVHGDPADPGLERGAPLELVEMGVGREVSVLHDVFGLALVPENRPDDPVETLIMSSNQNRVQLALALKHSPREDLVADFQASSLPVLGLRDGHDASSSSPSLPF
jgi:hypothetical protein